MQLDVYTVMYLTRYFIMSWMEDIVFNDITGVSLGHLI